MDHVSEGLTETWPKAVVATDDCGEIASVTLVHSQDEAGQLLAKLLEGHLLTEYTRKQFLGGHGVCPNFVSGEVRMVDLTAAQDVQTVYAIDPDETFEDEEADEDWEDDEDDE